MKISSIETGNFKVDGGAMFGVVPKVMWESIYECDEKNLCNCACRSMLIEIDGRKILVDTGIGDKLEGDHVKYYYLNGKDSLLKSLKNKGLDPKDITDIVLTHLHFDHCGGCSGKTSDGDLFLVFENADIWVSKSQWDWANNPNQREKPAYLEENLKPLEKSGKLKLVKSDMFIIPEVELRICNGHTKGLMSVFVKFNDRHIVFAGDLVPALPYLRDSYISAYDVLPLVAMEEKQNLLKELVENDDVLFFQHDINVEACTLKMTPKGVRENKIFKLHEIL